MIAVLTVLADTRKLCLPGRQLGDPSDFATADGQSIANSLYALKERYFASSKRKIHSTATAKQHGLVAYIVRKYDNNFQGSAIYLESVISLRHFALVCRSGQAIRMCQAVGICCLKIPSHAIDLRFPQGGEPRDARETESSCFTLSRSSGF
jgi:hypothetical protein